MRSTSIWGVKSLDPQDRVHMFWGPKSLAHHKLKTSLKSCVFQLPKRACMRGDRAAQGRHLLDGAWSCIPEHAQSSVDFIAELKSSILPNFSMIRPAAEILTRYALAAT